MTRTPELTPAEFNLMKVLWQLGKATVAEARAELNRKAPAELAYTTVMTLLGRLAAKGAVGVDREREPFVYRPAFRRESVLKERLRDFLHDVFDGEADAMVLGLVEDERLSIEELRAIEKRIGSDRTGGERTGSERTGSDRGGNDRNGNDRNGNDRTGGDRNGSDRSGSDRNGNDRNDRPADRGERPKRKART